MSVGGRLAFCGWVATLAASCALLPLAEPATWLLQAAFLIGVQSTVGVAGRRVPLARPLTVLLQVVVSALLLTLTFAREQAIGAVLPGPDAIARFGELLASGAEDVNRYATPAPVTDGIRLMLVGGVLVIGLLVDVLAVTYRTAAPAGLPLLALYSVAAGLAQGSLAWLWFLCAAAGYLLLLLAEGRERLSRWGRLFAERGPERPLGGRSRATVPVRTGRRIGVVALGIALAVPAVLPSLGGGLLENAGSGGGRAENGGSTISAVNPLVALQDSLNQPRDRTALTYTTSSEETGELYLRIVALDQFDGSAWKPSERRITDIPSALPPPRGLSPEVSTEEVRINLKAADWYAQDWLPMPYPAQQVKLDGDWRYEPEGRTVVGYRGQNTRGQEYEVESLQVEPTRQQLSQAPEPPPELKREYTDVPESLPSEVREKARTVTRGADNDYERAVRLQDWFARDGGFTYDTQVRAGSGSAAIVNFLEQKEGFCVHFSFAMASMARTLGIPARVAVGFTPGTPRGDGVTAVGLQDAHAWPELYFEGVGWTRFEPTPSRGIAPPYTQPDAPDPSENPGEQLPERNPSTSPTPEPSDSPSCTAEEKRADPSCGGPAAPADGAGGGGGFPWGEVAGIAGAALAVLAVPLLPLAWRARRRAVRLRAGRGPAETVLSGWRELLDTAWDHGVVPMESETPRKSAERVVRVGELEGEAAAAVHRVADSVEQVLYAPAPRPAPTVRGDVEAVRAGLRQAAPRGVRLRALLLPRSGARLWWAARERSSALRAGIVGRLTPRFSKG
ncbi:transglutaminase TgpA family protein [Streptomyces xiaopingdaonensis]|uniref:transglutaminase TgpA family protein n=1 Tax=Streptomyces xiaopingdaonensis TaxID=1565415 RepID=UPI000527C5FC|nr:DUF3488 and transglutaminase-like domain-containing protein [Streptomyces xiaopingdaonensis]